jgi:transcriptional regulator with XRE-family HTH domain
MTSEPTKDNITDLDSVMQSLLDFETDEEKLMFEAEMLHLATMQLVAQLMKENNMNKKQLAEALNTSQSFITQLFSGDKLLNFKLLAKLQRVFNVSFSINAGSRHLVNNSVDSSNDIKIKKRYIARAASRKNVGLLP